MTPAAATPVPTTKVKCLLVDDTPESLAAIAAILRRDDVELLTATGGIEALELLLVHDVALALLDVQMPGMDGFELAEAMRGTERTRHIPLIFITAGSRELTRQFKGYESGAVDFLFKPVEPRMLVHKAQVFFDLHRQRIALARELAESNERLRMNELFTAVLSHDLRNPLTALTLAAERMQRRAAEPEVRDSAQLMLQCADRMSQMIENLLDVARVRLAGGIELKREPADLARIVEGTLDEHRAAAGPRDIVFNCMGDTALDCDASRVAQVASNLVGNALRHGEAGTAVEVELDGRSAETLRLTVANRGRIPPELLPRLFDPFRGGARGPSRSAGLGLGLFIVEQVVRAHGGAVTVESPESGRTVFAVVLPRHAVGKAPPRTTAAALDDGIRTQPGSAPAAREYGRQPVY